MLNPEGSLHEAVRAPVFGSDIHMKLSVPHAMRVPSGEKATQVMPAVCTEVWTPVVESHRRMVLSSDADAMRVPSGEKATEVMLPVCPVPVER